MGNDVGELHYGFLTDKETFNKLHAILYEKWDLKPEYKDSPVELYKPYENEDYIVHISDNNAQFSAYNESYLLDNFPPNQETINQWNKILDDFVIKYDMTVEKENGWILTGRYD